MFLKHPESARETAANSQPAAPSVLARITKCVRERNGACEPVTAAGQTPIRPRERWFCRARPEQSIGQAVVLAGRAGSLGYASDSRLGEGRGFMPRFDCCD